MPQARRSASALTPVDETSRLRARIRELEETARRSEEMVATTLAMLGHELRSPLQSLLLNVGVCRERLRAQPGAPGLSDRLDKQHRVLERLRLLVDTLLDAGQISAGKLTLQLETVDLGEVVGDVARRAADDVAWAGCTLTLDAPAGITGRWDRLQLDLVASNLLANAIKYGLNGPIEMVVTGSPEQARLRVTDRGPGIARADQNRIFDKFVRLASPSAVGGFGLGLWIVRHIVEALGGQVTVHSELGQGASFVVTLPRAPR